MNLFREPNEPNERPAVLPRNGAGWITRFHLHRLTPTEQEVLLAWMGASPKRRIRDYLQAETIWRLSGGLSVYPDIQSEVTHLLSRPTPPYSAIPLHAEPEAVPE